MERKNTVFKVFLHSLNRDRVQCISLSRGLHAVSDPAPHLVMKVFAKLCSLFCGRQRWFVVTCTKVFLFVFNFYKNIQSLHTFLLHWWVSCNHGNLAWNLTLMLFVVCSFLVILARGTVRSAAMDAILFESSTGVQTFNGTLSWLLFSDGMC